MPRTAPSIAAAALACGLLACARDSRDRAVDTAEFGGVAILAPRGASARFAFVFSAAEGLAPADRAAARRLVEAGTTAALVDTRSAVERLSTPREPCVDLPGALEWISRGAQRELDFAKYREPVLLGRGAGAALAHAALVAAPPLSFAGGLGVDPGPLAHLAALCAPGGAHAAERAWHTASATAASGPKLEDLYLDAVAALGAHVAGADDASLDDLPLVELESRSPGKILAVFYSGDGGWRDLDRTIGEWLAGHGISVVGVDALRYFWSRRSPEEIARDLARVLNHYRERWSARRIALIGYSFGADILPFAFNRLPENLRREVELLVLLSPGHTAEFEIHLEDWLGAPDSSGALPILPEIAAIDAHRIQCISGAREAAQSLCSEPALAGAELIRTRGGHHFDGRYAELAARIQARLVVEDATRSE